MKRMESMLAIAALTLMSAACSDDDAATPENETDNIVVQGLIEEDQTWKADRIYELNGRVIVTEGVKLTIEPGTIIKGRDGQGANASALMIARGATIHAVGTADKPIIFTTVLDNIKVGEKRGTNLTERAEDRGKWGGLVVLGRAPISYAGSLEAQIEGVPAQEKLGLYGGDNSEDNSGRIEYVSIRHGGTEIFGGSEINGLTLGGVGSGTVIRNIEIFANYDDGIEFFGGTVNVSNVLVAHQGDDGIDVDQAYKGTVDGFMVIHSGDTDKGLEIDGPEGAENADGAFILKNGTLIGGGSAASPADFKSKAQGRVENVVFSGYESGKKILIASSYDESCGVGSNAFKNLVDAKLIFTNVRFDDYEVEVYPSHDESICDTSADKITAQSLIVSDDAAVGAPAVTTWSWTISASLALLP